MQAAAEETRAAPREALNAEVVRGAGDCAFDVRCMGNVPDFDAGVRSRYGQMDVVWVQGHAIDWFYLRFVESDVVYRARGRHGGVYSGTCFF